MCSSFSPGSLTTFPSRHSTQSATGVTTPAGRGKRLKAAQAADTRQAPQSQDEDEFTRRARLSWAKLIRRVYEVDPLLCPFCSAEMKILAFILDFGAAKATAKASSTRPKSPSRWLTRLRRLLISSPNPPDLLAASSHTREPGTRATGDGFKRPTLDLEISPRASTRIRTAVPVLTYAIPQKTKSLLRNERTRRVSRPDRRPHSGTLPADN